MLGCLYKLSECTSLLDMVLSFASLCTLSDCVRWVFGTWEYIYKPSISYYCLAFGILEIISELLISFPIPVLDRSLLMVWP